MKYVIMFTYDPELDAQVPADPGRVVPVGVSDADAAAGPGVERIPLLFGCCHPAVDQPA